MGFEESVRRRALRRRSKRRRKHAGLGALERVLPAEHCAGFMWMGLAAGGIRLYKHGITRRYLNLYLDPGGDELAYRYTGKGLRPRPAEGRIDAAFIGIERLAGVYEGDPRATPYDHECRALRDDRLREAGWTVISEPDSG